MRRMYIMVLLSALVLLGVDSCQDYPPPQRVYCSINADGSGFKEDYSLQISSLGKAFYMSDSMIFYLGDRLVKRAAGGSITALSPAGITITDPQYLAIDKHDARLYFAADNAICQVDMDGQNFSRISPVDDAIYRAPALSYPGNYLTAIRNGQIARMHIQSGTWTILPEAVSAWYAVYTEDTDEYYYFSRNTENYVQSSALCKLDAQRDSILIFSGDNSSGIDEFNAQASLDSRYFASHCMREPQEEWGMFGSSYIRYPSVLHVYDRQTGDSFTIEACFAYTFTQNSDALLFSRLKYGMADLMRMDLPSRQTSMIWDGYHSPHIYSYSVSEIYARSDGQVMHLKAWKRSNRKMDNSKSSTAPMLNEPSPSYTTQTTR